MDCLKFLSKSNMKKSGLFAAGVLFELKYLQVMMQKKYTQDVQQQCFVQKNV